MARSRSGPAPGGYVIQSSDISLDAATFEAAVDSAKATLRIDPASAERMSSDALSQWSGSPYADLGDEPALAPEIERLNDLRMQALEGRLDAALRAGRHADAVGPALQAMHRQVLEQSSELDLGDLGGDRFAFLATDVEASTRAPRRRATATTSGRRSTA